MNQKSPDKKKTKELEWEKELINSGKHLADILEQYNGNRQCKLCGAEPEKQSEWVIFLVKKLLTQQRIELLEEIKKLPDLTTTEFGEETISRLEVINLLNKKDEQT